MARTTKDVLKSMLTENTGKHFLDSGFENSRNWQRNQSVDFDSMPRAIISFKHGYISYETNIYPFLTDWLEYCPELDNDFHDFISFADNLDKGWLELMEEWLDARAESLEDFGDESVKNRITENSYNCENNLSQVIQFLAWREGHSQYILLQIHGGADVRGGYTAPHVFEIVDETFFCWADGYIRCPECGSNWHTDDSNHWYADHGVARLEDYPHIDTTEALMCQAHAIVDADLANLEAQGDMYGIRTRAQHMATLHSRYDQDTPFGEHDHLMAVCRDIAAGASVVLRTTKDGKAYCPHCNIGQLEA